MNKGRARQYDAEGLCKACGAEKGSPHSCDKAKVGHTPGPWQIINTDISRERTKTVITAKSKREFTLAQIHGFTQEEQDANAALIAAAPELLNQVSILLEACVLNIPSFKADTRYKRAMQVIAKTEGGG